MKTVVLLQLKYPHGGSQAYLPGSLMNLGSRLMAAGMDVEFFDHNVVRLATTKVLRAIYACDAVGISVLGTPYIPAAIHAVRKLRGMGFLGIVLIGGEGIIRLTPEQFRRLFEGSGDVRLVREDRDIVEALDLHTQRLPSMFETSMVPMLRTLAAADLRRYLRKEFCVFLSYGCIYNCNFCSAAKGVPERYRSMDALREEMDFICAFLASTDRPTLEIYVSNLDVLQSVETFEVALSLIHATASKHGVAVQARGLASTHSLCLAVSRDQDVLHRLHGYGLDAIGFGVDGADERVWQRENKRHNRLTETDQAIRMTVEAHMTPEVLMVTGFPQDDLPAMLATLLYSFEFRAHGAVLRPYLGKYGTPGSKTWMEDAELVRRYLAEPERFRLLDYAMFGSKATHPDVLQRWMANVCYAILILVGIRGDHATFPLFPASRGGILARAAASLLNRAMPFDH